MTLVATSVGLSVQTILSGTTPTDVATFPLGPNTPSCTLSIGGTFSGTVTFEVTLDGQQWWTAGFTKVSDGTIASTTTATGLFSMTNTGFAAVRARCSTYASGAITVQLGTGLW